MLQRVIAAVLAVLGLTTVGLAVASGTVWKPDEIVEARAVSGEGTTLLITDPGVLGLVSDVVTVTASRTADGQTNDGEVVLAIGRENDVLGWVGDDAHTLVTGLQSWEALNTSQVAGDTVAVESDSETDDSKDEEDNSESEPAEDDAEVPATAGSGLVGPSPAGSDMWLESATGDEQATLTWSSSTPNDRLLLLVANTGDNAPPPELALRWEREVSTPLMVPGIAVGTVLVLIGLLLFLSARRKSSVSDRVVRSRPRRSDAVADSHGSESETLTVSEPGTADDSGTEPLAVSGASAPVRQPAAESTENRTGMLEGAATSQVAGPTKPVVSHTPVAADEPADQPMSRRELREMAEREAAEQVRTRRSGRLKRRRSEPADQDDDAQGHDLPESDGREHDVREHGAGNDVAGGHSAPEPDALAPATPQTRSSARSARSTRSVRSTRSIRSSISAVTGSFPQVATPPEAENSELTAQDRNRADAWRKAWGFQQSWDAPENTDDASEGDKE